jgi:hypothetical protein
MKKKCKRFIELQILFLFGINFSCCTLSAEIFELHREHVQITTSYQYVHKSGIYG